MKQAETWIANLAIERFGNSTDIEIVFACRAMLSGEMHLIEGVRRIARLWDQSSCPEKDAFLAIRAIESETEHFPLGAVRSHYAMEYIQSLDVELDAYLSDAKDDIRSTCTELIQAIER